MPDSDMPEVRFAPTGHSFPCLAHLTGEIRRGFSDLMQSGVLFAAPWADCYGCSPAVWQDWHTGSC
jgi:hypothetical protein